MTETGKQLNGRCMCGAVTLTMIPARDEIVACHCGQCRRWTGSAFLEIPAAPGTLTVEGPVRSFTSSDWAERANCGTCGSPLWYRLTVPGTDFHAVAAGLFDDAGGFALSEEIYIDCKPDGFEFAGAHARLTEEEFKARMAAQQEGQE